MFEDGELEKAIVGGLYYQCTPPTNALTAYDFPIHSIVFISDDNPEVDPVV